VISEAAGRTPLESQFVRQDLAGGSGDHDVQNVDGVGLERRRGKPLGEDHAGGAGDHECQFAAVHAESSPEV
jgi:hypothetical protein